MLLHIHYTSFCVIFKYIGKKSQNFQKNESEFVLLYGISYARLRVPNIRRLMPNVLSAFSVHCISVYIEKAGKHFPCVQVFFFLQIFIKRQRVPRTLKRLPQYVHIGILRKAEFGAAALPCSARVRRKKVARSPLL